MNALPLAAAHTQPAGPVTVTALVNLERQKGTLLDYNNIVIRGVNEENYLEPAKPIGP